VKSKKAGSNHRFELAFPKIMKRIVLLLVMPLAVEAQTTINGGRVIKGTLDASGATSTLPYRTGSGSPAGRDNCGKPGEAYFQTDALAGQNVWGCTASGTPGTWNQLSAGATVATGTTAPSGSCSAGALYVRTDVRQFYICSAANIWQLGSYVSNVLANRPVNCATGQVFLATDLGTLSFCATPGNPGSWQAVGGAIASVFGRTGAVTAQTGDYTAAQVTNAAQTNAGNTFTAGTQDFSQAAHTLPAKVGTVRARPATCVIGEMYFANDAAAGQNWYYCTAANTWTQQSSPAAPVPSVFGRTGTVTAQTGDYTAAQVTNAAQTNAGNTFTAGTHNFSGAAHTLPAVTGVTASRPATCTVGEVYFATDAPAGRNWNFCTGTNTWTATGEAVPSVFGRTGAVTAQAGDYTAAQVTNAVAVNTANSWTGGFLQNFSADDMLLPVHASDPATCTAGQLEFNSRSVNGKLCTSTNNWTALSTGGGITQLTGDVTAGPGSGAMTATVAKINGTTVPTNSAPDQTIVTTVSSTAAWASLANCVAAGGVLQYATATHSYSCHTLGAADIPTALPNTTAVNGTTIPASTTLMTTSTALAAGQEPAHTGDVTNPSGSLAMTLATVNSSPGSCGDAAHVCQVTTNGKGLVTGQSAVAITASGSTAETNISPVFGGTTNITLGMSTVFNLGTLTGNTTIAVSGPTGGVGDYFVGCMDATGGRSVTWPASFKNAPAFDPTPNACSMIGPIVYDGSANYYKQGTTTAGLVALGATASACSGTVSSGQLCMWMDTTRGTVAAKDSSGNIYVMAKTAGSTSQLASSDLSDSAQLARVVGTATVTVPTTQVAANSCDASATATTVTGANAATDVWSATPTGDPTGATGYGGGTNGGITLWIWLSTNTVNLKRCNQAGLAITPGALSLLVKVLR